MRKKVFASIVFLVVMLFTVVGWAADWYVRPAGGNYGDEDGTSYENAWDGLSNIVWGAGGVQAGDTLWVLGTHHDKLTVGASGTSSNYIAIRGDHNDQSGTIRAVWEVPSWNTSANWTEESANIWYIDLSSLAYPNPYRLWIDGVERKKAQAKTDLSANDPWWYDSTNKYLYVYSTANPAISFTNLEGLQSDETSSFYTALKLVSKDYIQIKNINIEGGSYGSLYIRGASNIIISNCKVGKDAHYGIQIYDYGGTPSSNCEIRNCQIASNFAFTYDYEWDGAADGIQASSVQNCKFYKNVVKNWGHSAIGLRRLTGTHPNCTNNEIYKNDISAPNISYGRGIDIYGSAEGECSGNIITRNIIHDTTIKNQLAGDNNEFSYNLVYDLTDSPVQDWGSDGLNLRGDTLCKNIKVVNNTFVNIADSGLWYDDRAGNTGNVIANNIFINCGVDSDTGYDNIGIRIEDGAESATFKNNCVYSEATAATIYYRSDGAITVNSFNTKTNDTISGNISSDPLLTSTYHLRPNSPCIDAGVKLSIHNSSWKDLAGNRTRYGTAPDIGCYEYKTWPRGAWGMLPWIGGRHKVQWTPYE